MAEQAGPGPRGRLCQGQYENKIHTLLAAGDIPFVPAGRRMALDPDNILVRSSTRHPITSAGIGASIERLGALLAAMERGDRQGVPSGRSDQRRSSTALPTASNTPPRRARPLAAAREVAGPTSSTPKISCRLIVAKDERAGRSNTTSTTGLAT